MMTIALLAVFAVMLPPPAAADLACMLGRMPESLRVAAIAEATSSPGGPVQQRIIQIGFECMRLRHWSTEQTATIAVYAAATATHDSAHAILLREGFDLAFVDRWLDARQSLTDLGRDPKDTTLALVADMEQAHVLTGLTAPATSALIMYVYTDRELKKHAAAL